MIKNLHVHHHSVSADPFCGPSLPFASPHCLKQIAAYLVLSINVSGVHCEGAHTGVFPQCHPPMLALFSFKAKLV